MRAARREQLDLDIEEPPMTEAERDADDDEQRLLFAHLMVAFRAAQRDIGGSDAMAAELDRVWAHEDVGHGVSASVVRSAFSATNSERNYSRVEWLITLARKSPLVAEILLEIVGRARPKKTPEDELEDLKGVLRSEYPKQAERLIRKGAAPR